MAAEILAEPVPVRVTRWLCPFCRRGRSARKATAEHIGRCWENPANRTCKTCANYTYDEAEPEVGLPAYQECDAGIDLDDGDFPKTGCPLWALRKDDD